MNRSRRIESLLALPLAGLAGCAAPHEQPTTAPTATSGPAHVSAPVSTAPSDSWDTLDAESAAQLDRLVRDVCDKSVVLLGENPRHGGERTLELKAALVPRLIDRCGFNAVYFESGVYEFVDLNRRLAARASASEQVADAIGGLWSASRQLDPLTRYLFDRASAGKIRLGGIDPQLGSATSRYAKTDLAADLVKGLGEPRRANCAEIIAQHTNWRYDAEHPFDDAARENMTQCFREAAASLPPGSPTAKLAQAATAISTDLSGSVPWREARERQLAELFRWNQQQRPARNKAIVWTANVHAAYLVDSINGPMRPFGDELREEYGDRMASIAFNALGGEYGYRKAASIAEAAPASLEAEALAAGSKPLVYLTKADLARFGEVDGTLLGYGRAKKANWSLLFDGVVVLREEKPMSMDYPPEPRFAPPR